MKLGNQALTANKEVRRILAAVLLANGGNCFVTKELYASVTDPNRLYVFELRESFGEGFEISVREIPRDKWTV